MDNNIKLILGTMTFGERIFGDDVGKIIDLFLQSGYRELDTAFVYNGGESERLLGQALASMDRDRFKIATKVNPRITSRLDYDAVLSQCTESLARLRLDSVDILYLHFPDPDTPLESALKACAELQENGKFKELGVSNFPAWLVAETCHICDSHGWIRPTVYEGLYNPLSRFAERELDRALDYYGMRFYAYNPLAGGMLTDKYSGSDRTLKEGRFLTRPNYQGRYWKDSYFSAVDRVKAVCAKFEINIVEATYRWLAFHSMLKAERGDGILIGVSKISQLQQNMGAIEKGPLPSDIVNAFEEAWEICRPDAPEYFKYYQK